MPDVELPEALQPLAWIVGRWWGFGIGGYEGIDGFRYEQELSFTHDGRPFLTYSSRTWLIDEDGERLRPGGSENGFWRPGPAPRDVEALITHNTGFLELSLGEVVFNKLEMVSDLLARTSTAREVAGLKRLYGLIEGDLAYAVDMAAEGKSLQAHISARLQLLPD